MSHEQYGTGTITDKDVHHTVIDFDAHGSRRFVTDRVVLAPTSTPAPSASERREAGLRQRAARTPKRTP